jgi:activator of HSP90 ATPase
MKTISQEYRIRAPKSKVWQALTDPQVIDKWSGGKAVMDDQVGTKFSLWGGDSHGINKEVVANKKLVQEWFGGEWLEPSEATFTLTYKDGWTMVHLRHKNVPDNEAAAIADGWDRYYLGEIKKLLEK